jgi:hypothetical protein
MHGSPAGKWSIAEVNMYKGTLRNPAGSVSELLLRRLAPVYAGIVAINVVGAADVRAAQQPPPIHGVTGTIATDETVEDVHEVGRGILGKVARLFRWRRSVAPSGDEAGEETFAGLNTGTAVVVQNTTAGENPTAEELDRRDDEGVKRVEGVITAVNRRDRTISIRLADGTRQTLRLSDGAADGADKVVDRAGVGARVIVFVKGEAGERIVHYFKRVS